MASLVLTGDTSGQVTIAAPAVAGTNTLTLQAATATNAVNILATAVTSTSGTSIEDLVDQIQLWLPKEQSASGSQNVYVECTVEGFNDCLNKIKSKLR